MKCSRSIFNLLKNFENELSDINKDNINESNDSLSSKSFQYNHQNDKIYTKEKYYIKEEYNINYLKLKRKGFQYLLKRNYYSCFISFQGCYNISKNYLRDKIKQIDSLINMSICEYYNGNFKNSVFCIEEAKIIYEKISLEYCHITQVEKIWLGLKLYSNSSMTNLSMNNYNISINDIKKIFDLINIEKKNKKKLSYLKNVIYTLFKVDSLLYINSENKLLTNDKNTIKNNVFDNYSYINNYEKDIYEANLNNIEILMNDFLVSLKYNNNMILLNSFIENGKKYKKNNDFTGFYFCIFNQYLIICHYIISKKANIDNNYESDIKELKRRLYLYNKHLIGKEILSQMDDKNKEILKFIQEFNDKMECSSKIFTLLKNVENELSNKIENIYIEKYYSPYIIKLVLLYSLKRLYKKQLYYEIEINKKHKNKNIQKENEDYQIEIYKNIKNNNNLIKELKKLLYKIKNYEIDLSLIQSNKIISSTFIKIKILFKNVIFIYYKSTLYQSFHKYRAIIHIIKMRKLYKKIHKFLSKNYEEIVEGMNLVKIKNGSNGYKTHFYSLDSDSNTFMIKEVEIQNNNTYSYILLKDVTKIMYGIKTVNLGNNARDKKDEDNESIKLLRQPWRFLSFIIKKRSLDLYCNDVQLNNWFYGLKLFTNENNVEYKMISSHKFVLLKIKFKMIMKLKEAIKDGEIRDENHKYNKIIDRLNIEKDIKKVSFTKLILFYNRLMNQ